MASLKFIFQSSVTEPSKVASRNIFQKSSQSKMRKSSKRILKFLQKILWGTKKPDLFCFLYSWRAGKQRSKAEFLCSYLEPGKLDAMEEVMIKSQVLEDFRWVWQHECDEMAWSQPSLYGVNTLLQVFRMRN